MSETIPKDSHPAEQFTGQLFALPDLTAQKNLLAHATALLTDEVAFRIKLQADHCLRSDIQRSLQFAELILYMEQLTGKANYRALGLLAKGNALSIGLGEYQQALAVLNEASALFRAQGYKVWEARVEISRLWALASLGNYTEAFASGATACQILREYKEWQPLVRAIMNLGVLHHRQGEDMQALALYDEAIELCPALEAEEESYRAWIQQNRATSLRNLGRFDEALVASQIAQTTLQQLEQPIEAAHAQENQAMTYYIVGRYNEALEQLDQVYTIFEQDGRQLEATEVELFISDCLLKLRRFPEVLEKCQRVRQLFRERGVEQIVAQAIVNEAIAYANLGRPSEALASLQEACAIFQAVGNLVWVALTQQETAAILQHQGNHSASLIEAEKAIAIFRTHSRPHEEAQTNLIMAQAALALEKYDQAQTLIDQALAIGLQKNLPTLTYHAYQLLGLLAETQNATTVALANYDRAIQELEQLRGRLMVEYRANFLEDKQSIYEDAVRLCLTAAQPQRGLEYAERAKSRALLEMINFRLDLSLTAYSPTDQPLVEELHALRTTRDQLYRRWESNEEIKLRNCDAVNGTQEHQQQILGLEKRITELWHKLLVHNAHYAREAALWQIRTEPVQHYLPPDTVLLEYFVIRGELLVFVVTSTSIAAHMLGCQLTQVQRILQLLQVNLNLTSRSSAEQIQRLTMNAQGLLRQLYQLLLAPITDAVQHHHVIIVPHGSLHYLPFHALYDGQHYFLEEHQISYLPGSSLLRYCQEAEPVKLGAFVYGHSAQGQLPNVRDEIAAVAQALGVKALTENEIDRTQIQQLMVDQRVVHLATHGEFRTDNPLFSGLIIGNDCLTTMDIFNLRMRASLVTLSACQTGRSVIQGGDELFGLMRAFLATGTASLVLSLWSVEDRSTAQFMQTFYQYLAQGETKGAALRQAQLQFIKQKYNAGNPMEFYTHPYFWAPFFLVGASGHL